MRRREERVREGERERVRVDGMGRELEIGKMRGKRQGR